MRGINMSGCLFYMVRRGIGCYRYGRANMGRGVFGLGGGFGGGGVVFVLLGWTVAHI